MDRDMTAQQLADQLFAFEEALDHALALGGENVASITRARRGLGLGIKVGAGALSKLAASTERLAAIREQVGEAHDELAAVQRKLGLRPNLFGGGDKGSNDEALPVLRRVS